MKKCYPVICCRRSGNKPAQVGPVLHDFMAACTKRSVNILYGLKIPGRAVSKIVSKDGHTAKSVLEESTEAAVKTSMNIILSACVFFEGCASGINGILDKWLAFSPQLTKPRPLHIPNLLCLQRLTIHPHLINRAI